jgi:hypothetical protein
MHLFGCADAKAVSGKKSKPSIKLLEASSQRIIPGIPGAAIRTNYHFIVIWNSAQSPDKFFWKNEKDQAYCRITKITSIGSHSINAAIRRGDTLSISALKDKEVQTPAGISSKAKNTLFFKTKSSGWVRYPVKKISKKPDEAMP